MGTRKIYYESLGIHTYMQTIINRPPQGYEFVVNSGDGRKKFLNRLKKSKTVSYIYKNIIKNTFNVLPLVKRMYQGKSAPDTDLILTTSSVITEKKPWILLILDSPYSLAGNDYKLFMKNKASLEKALASEYCKRIIVHTEACANLMKQHFSPEVCAKIALIRPAIPLTINSKAKKKTKEVTFLFMGSINNPSEFYLKGGLETLETFKKLSESHKNVRLIVKCKVPNEVKEKYMLPNIEFIEGMISTEEVNNLYKRSDVLFLPGYNYFIMAYFEAFSFGVPIMSLDTYGVSEFIEQGKNGFYVKPSSMIPMSDPSYPANNRSEEFIEAIKNIDPRVIQELANVASTLIKSTKLRSKMSKETLAIFKKKYSFERQNKELKEVFDEALSTKQ